MDNDIIGSAAMVVLLLAILYAAYIAMGHVLGKGNDNKTAKEEMPNSMEETILTIIGCIGIISLFTFIAMYFVFNILGESTIRSELSKGILTVSDNGMVVSVFLLLLLWTKPIKEKDLDGLYENSLKDICLTLILAILLGVFFASLVVCGVGIYGFYFQGMGGEIILYALFASLASMFLTQVLRQVLINNIETFENKGEVSTEVLNNIKIYENKGGVKHRLDVFKK